MREKGEEMGWLSIDTDNCSSNSAKGKSLERFQALLNQ